MDGLLGNEYSPDFLKAIGVDPEKMKQQQQTQGLLNAGLALLAGSGPSSQPRSLGQLVGAAGMQGLQAMRGAGEDQISNAIRSLQVKDMVTKREQQAAQKAAMDKFLLTLPEADRAKFSAFPTQAAEAMFRKPVEDPTSYREFVLAKSDPTNPFKGSYNDWMKANPRGNVVYNYPPGALPLGKEASSQLDDMLMSSGRRMQTYSAIQSSFKPEYLSIPFRGAQAWSTLKDKFGGLPDDQKKILGEYSAFRQNAVDNLNRTIKEITGAAMAESEAQRIIAGLPNAGTGVFDGDSPTEFQAKLDNSMKQVKLVEARAVYMKKNGLSLKDIPLSNMPQVINDRAKQIAKEQGLDVNKPEDQQRIKMQLSSEFGITNQ
jgi:hypothetical protein